MTSYRTTFVKNLFGNLRLSGIVCVVVFVGLCIYSLIVSEPIMWDIVVFLSIGMAISSLFNAWADARRARHRPS